MCSFYYLIESSRDCRVASLLAMTEREIDSRFRGNDMKENGDDKRRLSP